MTDSTDGQRAKKVETDGQRAQDAETVEADGQRAQSEKNSKNPKGQRAQGGGVSSDGQRAQ